MDEVCTHLPGVRAFAGLLCWALILFRFESPGRRRKSALTSNVKTSAGKFFVDVETGVAQGSSLQVGMVLPL